MKGPLSCQNRWVDSHHHWAVCRRNPARHSWCLHTLSLVIYVSTPGHWVGVQGNAESETAADCIQGAWLRSTLGTSRSLPSAHPSSPQTLSKLCQLAKVKGPQPSCASRATASLIQRMAGCPLRLQGRQETKGAHTGQSTRGQPGISSDGQLPQGAMARGHPHLSTRRQGHGHPCTLLPSASRCSVCTTTRGDNVNRGTRPPSARGSRRYGS